MIRLSDMDRHIQRAAKAAERFHWGRPVRKLRAVRVPDAPRALVKLGELVRVDYSTEKGDDDGPTTYYHHFDPPYAVLALDPEAGELHIVRGRSRYRVTERGIEG